MKQLNQPGTGIAVSVGVALSLLLIPSCSSGSSERVEALAPAEAAPADAVPTEPTPEGDATIVSVPPEHVSVDEVFGTDGTRPVVNGADLSQRGFIRNADVVPAPGEPPYSVVNVYDENGAHIAYWGNGAGWLSKEVVEAATFRLEDHQDP